MFDCESYTCVHAKLLQSCLTLCNPMDCIPSGSSVHGISQARILKRVAISSSRASSDPEIKPMSPAVPELQVDFSTAEPQGKPESYTYRAVYYYYHHYLTLHFVAVVDQSLSHVWIFGPHGLQHTRLLCPPLPPGICSNSCALSQWCYLTISFCLFLLVLCSVFPSITLNFIIHSSLSKYQVLFLCINNTVNVENPNTKDLVSAL